MTVAARRELLEKWYRSGESSHWEGEKKPDPTLFGFVYLITNTVNGRLYIGKKQYYHIRYVKVNGRRRKSCKSSGWEYYTGSSKELNKDIKKYGKDKFKFEILWNCTTRSVLHWMEIVEQVDSRVMTKTIDGSNERRYYNKQIAAIRFIPSGEAL